MGYSRIVVALDMASGNAEMILQRALQFANGAKVTAMHVVERHPYSGDEVSFQTLSSLHERVMQEGAQRLAALCASAGIERHAVLEGRPASEILRYAEAQGADLIIMGTHGRSGWQRILGSTANAVLHGAKTDILTVLLPDGER